MMKIARWRPAAPCYWLGAPTVLERHEAERRDQRAERGRAGGGEAAPEVTTSTPTRCSSTPTASTPTTCPTRTASLITMRARRRRALHDGRRQLPRRAVFKLDRRAVQGDRAGGRRRDQADDPDRGQHAGRARQRLSPGGNVGTTPPATGNTDEHRRHRAPTPPNDHAAGDHATDHVADPRRPRRRPTQPTTPSPPTAPTSERRRDRQGRR